MNLTEIFPSEHETWYLKTLIHNVSLSPLYKHPQHLCWSLSATVKWQDYNSCISKSRPHKKSSFSQIFIWLVCEWSYLTSQVFHQGQLLMKGILTPHSKLWSGIFFITKVFEFYVLNKSINLSWVWSCKPRVSRQAHYPDHQGRHVQSNLKIKMTVSGSQL